MLKVMLFLPFLEDFYISMPVRAKGEDRGRDVQYDSINDDHPHCPANDLVASLSAQDEM